MLVRKRGKIGERRKMSWLGVSRERRSQVTDTVLVFAQEPFVVLIAVAIATDINFRRHSPRHRLLDSLDDDEIDNKRTGNRRT